MHRRSDRNSRSRRSCLVMRGRYWHKADIESGSRFKCAMSADDPKRTRSHMVVPERAGAENLHPLGIAGLSTQLWLAPPGQIPEKPPTSVSPASLNRCRASWQTRRARRLSTRSAQSVRSCVTGTNPAPLSGDHARHCRKSGRPSASAGGIIAMTPAGGCPSHDLQILCRRLAFVGYFFVLNGLPLIEGA
jgi:hypothetical protein